MLMSLRRLWSPDWVPIALAQVVGILCGLVGIRLMSAWVAPEVLGVYGLCLSLAPAGALLTHYGLSRHVARHWPLQGDVRPYHAHMSAAARRASLLLCGLLAGALALLGGIVEISYGKILPWMLIAGLAGAYGSLLHGVLQTTRSYWTDCVVSCGNSLARTGGPLLGVILAGASTPVLLAGFALPQALVLIIAWWWALGRFLCSRRPPAPENPAVKKEELAEYGRTFWLIGACTLAGGGLHRALAAFCLDAKELGYFTLAGNLAFVIPNVLSAALTQFLYPRIFAQARKAPDGSWWLRPVEAGATAFAILSFAATLALHAVAPWLLGTLIHPDYEGAIPHLIANGGYATTLALGHFYQLPAIAANRPDAARRSMLGLISLLALGGGAAASFSAGAYTAWLTFSPLAGAFWLATTARISRRKS